MPAPDPTAGPGNADEAEQGFKAALELAGTIGAEHERARALVGLAKISRAGDPATALDRLNEALPTLERVSEAEAGEARRLLSELAVLVG